MIRIRTSRKGLQRTQHLILASLLWAGLGIGQSARAQAYGPAWGSMPPQTSNSGGFSPQELDHLTKLCTTMYANFLSTDKQRASQRSDQVNVSAGVNVLTQSGSLDVNTATQQSNQSRDTRVDSSQGMTSCDGIIGPYFRYKEAQLFAQSQTTIGLANADANKSVGLANAKSNKVVGLANADAIKSVGMANSQAQLYTGIAGSAGNMLGSIFSSGSQKAAVQAQANAEVEKAKIIAAAEVEKARLQLELARMQAAPQQPAPYSGYYPAAAQPAPQPYPAQPYQAQSYPQQSYPQQSYPQQGYPQQAYPQPSYPQQQPYAPAGYPPAGYPAPMAAPSASPAQPSVAVASAAPANLARVFADLGLVPDPNCGPGAVVILTRTGARACAFPKSTLPGGQYLYDNSRLQRY